jgi:hypothetical protein
VDFRCELRNLRHRSHHGFRRLLRWPRRVKYGQRAFLLDASSLLVLEPASIVLLGIGAAAMLWWRGWDDSMG